MIELYWVDLKRFLPIRIYTILGKENFMTFTSFKDFFTALKSAELDFGAIWEFIRNTYYEMTANPDLSAIWDGIMSFIGPVYKTVMTFAVIGCVLIAFFGKKIKGFLTFGFFFVMGFALGTHFLAPIIPEAVVIPGWLVGLVVSIVAAVIHRFLYYILYAVAVGYSIYILSFNGFYFASEVSYTAGKALVCLAIAAVCTVVAFLFRKYIEMVGTAALGAWLASWLFANYIYAYSALPVFSGAPWVAILIPTVIIGTLGAIVQVKTRRRY